MPGVLWTIIPGMVRRDAIIMTTQQGMPLQPLQGNFAGNSGPLSSSAARITGKLLATQGYVVGIEISGSGSHQSVAIADLQGQILYRVRRPLDYVPDTQTVLDMIESMLNDVKSSGKLQDGRILRVGVAIGGLVDSSRGIVRTLHHAHSWNDFPLQDYLEQQLDMPCIIDNNANAAALAETRVGALCEERDTRHKFEPVVLYVGLGRGIGGGLVVNGKIYHGTTCTAGEIGHLIVKENGPKCSCGGYGHLEAIASAQAISRNMIGLSVEYPETEAAIRRITGSRAERITSEQVFRLATDGDKIAQRIVNDVHTYLAIALANIVHIINPGVIILGGQVARVGELLIAPLQARLDDLCLAASRPVRIVQGTLGSEANIVGAVMLALQDI